MTEMQAPVNSENSEALSTSWHRNLDLCSSTVRLIQNIRTSHLCTNLRMLIQIFACLLRWYEAVPEVKHKLWWLDVLYFNTPAASTS